MKRVRFAFVFPVLFAVIFYSCLRNDSNQVIEAPPVYQNHQGWDYNLGIYEVNVRQYTAEGTFAAFQAHLPRLKNMGVGILWFMPIHPIGVKNRKGTLGSYYSVKDYLDVNPEFGTLADFKSLAARVHSIGMYVVIDWVANHTAWDNSLTVQHPEWYVKDANGNFTPPYGTNWTDVIQLDYSNQSLRTYMIGAMKFWIKEAAVDGFRCDAVGFLPIDFWKQATAELKAYKKDILLLAEGDGVSYHLNGFDMTYAMGYHSGFGGGLINDIYNGAKNANDLAALLTSELTLYPPDAYRMYYTSNHDDNSWAGTEYEQLGVSAELFAVLTNTMNGMPLLYSGQESGLNKRLLFFDKDQIDWGNFPLSSLYTTLLQLKKNNQALWNGANGGGAQRVQTSDDQDVFAFVRESGAGKVFAAFNLSGSPRAVQLKGSLVAGTYKDIFTTYQQALSDGDSLILGPWKYVVLEKLMK